MIAAFGQRDRPNACKSRVFHRCSPDFWLEKRWCASISAVPGLCGSVPWHRLGRQETTSEGHGTGGDTGPAKRVTHGAFSKAPRPFSDGQVAVYPRFWIEKSKGHEPLSWISWLGAQLKGLESRTRGPTRAASTRSCARPHTRRGRGSTWRTRIGGSMGAAAS